MLKAVAFVVVVLCSFLWCAFSFLWIQVEELKETVKEEFMPWVSQYLVMKRVSIEPNFHSLYSNFLDTLKNPEFNKMVLNETYRNIKVSSTSSNTWVGFKF